MMRIKYARALAAGAIVTVAFATPVFAQEKQQDKQVCIYRSETYSDGAYVCAQRSLMQQCSVSGSGVTWRIVADKELSKLCVGPVVRQEAVRRSKRVRYAAARRSFTPAIINPQSSAKCFQFNGKKYCE